MFFAQAPEDPEQLRSPSRGQVERNKNPGNPVNPVKKVFEFQKAKPIH